MDTMTATIQSRIRQDQLDAPRRISDNDLLPTWQRALSIGETIATEIAKEEVRLKADERLTEAGRREALAKGAQGKVAALKAISTLRAEVTAAAQRQRVDVCEVSKYQCADKIEEVYELLLGQEIRTSARGKSQAELIHFFQDAVTNGHVQVQRALLHGPMGPMLPHDLARRMLEAHVEQTQPAKYRRLQSTEALRDHLVSLEQHAAMWFKSLGVDLDKA